MHLLSCLSLCLWFYEIVGLLQFNSSIIWLFPEYYIKLVFFYFFFGSPQVNQLTDFWYYFMIPKEQKLESFRSFLLLFALFLCALLHFRCRPAQAVGFSRTARSFYLLSWFYLFFIFLAKCLYVISINLFLNIFLPSSWLWGEFFIPCLHIRLFLPSYLK